MEYNLCINSYWSILEYCYIIISPRAQCISECFSCLSPKLFVMWKKKDYTQLRRKKSHVVGQLVILSLVITCFINSFASKWLMHGNVSICTRKSQEIWLTNLCSAIRSTITLKIITSQWNWSKLCVVFIFRPRAWLGWFKDLLNDTVGTFILFRWNLYMAMDVLRYSVIYLSL